MNTSHLLILGTISVVWLAAWIAAIVSIASTPLAMTPVARGLWIAVAIIFPIAGPIVWFVGGRPHFARSRTAAAAVHA